MMNLNRLVLFTLAITAACTSEPQPPRATAAEKEPTIELSLAVATDHLEAGSPFQLASHFAIEEGWHIYWEHPGDAGIPTRLDFDLPDGFQIRDTRYSTPRRFETAGDIVTYGYEHQALLATTIEADPKSSFAEPVTIRVRARWLACKEACIPGEATATIEIPSATPTEQAVAKMTSFPGDAAELEEAIFSWLPDTRSPILAVEVAGATNLDFYPAQNGSTHLESRETTHKDQATSLRLAFAVNPTYPEPPPTSQGVLLVERDGETSYYDVALPWPVIEARQ